MGFVYAHSTFSLGQGLFWLIMLQKNIFPSFFFLCKCYLYRWRYGTVVINIWKCYYAGYYENMKRKEDNRNVKLSHPFV